jgi:predicted transcriptional regulator
MREEKVSRMRRDQEGLQQAELKKTLQKFVKLCVCENRRLTVRSIAEQVNIDRETVRKVLTEEGGCVQKWSQRSSPKNKSKEESQFS